MKKILGGVIFLLLGITCYASPVNCNSLGQFILALGLSDASSGNEGYKIGYEHGYNGIGYQNSGASERYKSAYHSGFFDGIAAKKDYNDGYQKGYADKMEGKEFVSQNQSKDYAKGYQQGWNQASSVFAMEYQNGYKAGYDHASQKRAPVDLERKENLTGAFKKGYREGYSLGKS